jgi:hypothetical protein
VGDEAVVVLDGVGLAANRGREGGEVGEGGRGERARGRERGERKTRKKNSPNLFSFSKLQNNGRHSRQPAPRVLLDHRAQQGSPRAPTLGEEGGVEVELDDLLLLLQLLSLLPLRRRLGQQELLDLPLLSLLLLLLLSPSIPSRCCKEILLLELDADEHRGCRRRCCCGGGCGGRGEGRKRERRSKR